jgi:hypothetical protein
MSRALCYLPRRYFGKLTSCHRREELPTHLLVTVPKLCISTIFGCEKLLNNTINTFSRNRRLCNPTSTHILHSEARFHLQDVPPPTCTRNSTRSLCSPSSRPLPLPFYKPCTVCAKRRTRQGLAEATVNRVCEIWLRRWRSTFRHSL